MTEVKRKSNVKNILILIVLTIVGIYMWAALMASNISRTTPTPTPVDNTAALQNCIDKNVAPLENLAAISNAAQGATYVNAAQVSLDACKASYPTN